MANFLYVFGILLVFLCYCHTSPPSRSKIQQNLVDGKGLYDESDKVSIVNATTFKKTICGTPNAWVVEFYNSWCGHCFMFAPKWKALASDIYGWGKVVKLAVIDCSTEANNPTCRDYDIMGYPTLKFFPAHAPSSFLGTELQRDALGTGSSPEIERVIVGILKKEQMEGRGSHWPNITPYRGSDIGNIQSNNNKYLFLICEHEDSSLGTELALDFSYFENIEIRSVLSDNEALIRTLGVHRFPSVVYLAQGRTDTEKLNPAESNRKGFRDAIRSFLTAKGITLSAREGNGTKEINVFDEINVTEQAPEVIPDLGELMQMNHAKTQLKMIKEKGDVVYLADLESAIRYMLQHEITNRKVIRDEALTALHNFLAVIAKYFPSGESGIQYFQQLRDACIHEGKEVRGIRFKVLVKNVSGGLESAMATSNGWIGCLGSQANLRGYTCGVWSLFHYLTVSSLKAADHMEVLNAMLGYITHFFGCSECSQHFQEMAGRTMRAKATDNERALLWLWSAHNEVNKRLAGAATEDPEFPKIQYPNPQDCPRCRDSAGRWNEPAVVSYLKNKYHQDNLNYEGANNVDHKPAILARKLVEVTEESHHKYFNSLDISLCIGLYALSIIICFAVCWKFVLRRHFRSLFSVSKLSRSYRQFINLGSIDS